MCKALRTVPGVVSAAGKPVGVSVVIMIISGRPEGESQREPVRGHESRSSVCCGRDTWPHTATPAPRSAGTSAPSPQLGLPGESRDGLTSVTFPQASPEGPQEGEE